MKTTLPLVVLVLLAGGCSQVSESVESGTAAVVTGHPGGAHRPRNTNRYDLENSEKFVLLSKRAERSITCSGIQERPQEDGRLQVVANIRNRLRRQVQVQVNCVFKDEQGFPIGDETPFQTLILTENAQEGVSFVSMNNKAKRYTIRVRELR